MTAFSSVTLAPFSVTLAPFSVTLAPFSVTPAQARAHARHSYSSPQITKISEP